VRLIGLTGGIGAGKSVVASTLAALGAEVIDADHEGHEAYARGSIGWRRLTELFGSRLLDEEFAIDRRKLGELVFGSKQAMAWLNAAIHPLIRGRISARLAELKKQNVEAVVLDAALLYQAGWDDLTDEVWVIRAPVGSVVSRLMEQRGLRDTEARARIDAQEPADRLADRADVVIDNTGSLEELQRTVEQFWTDRILTS
jgi:dephospho-CoA kinase